MYDLMNFGKFGCINLEVHKLWSSRRPQLVKFMKSQQIFQNTNVKPEVREMIICYFMKVPEVERQVRDKYTKFTKDHIFHKLPFAGEVLKFSHFSWGYLPCNVSSKQTNRQICMP